MYDPLYDEYWKDFNDDDVVDSPEDAPCKYDAKVAEAIACVADFAKMTYYVIGNIGQKWP